MPMPSKLVLGFSLLGTKRTIGRPAPLAGRRRSVTYGWDSEFESPCLQRGSANFRFPSGPFWLIRVDAPKTREGLAHIAAVRREEVVRFIEGISIFALPTATGCAVCIACRPLAAGLALHRGR